MMKNCHLYIPMQICIVFCTLSLSWFYLANADESLEPKIVCYYSSWAGYRSGHGKFDVADIDPTLCTHLIYAFVGISIEGEVIILDPSNDLPGDGGKSGFKRFIALRKISPETRFMVSIGGWNEGSVKYSTVMANKTTRASFVKNVVAFILIYGFDGFDVCWEYPNQRGGISSDVENFVNLLRELRAAFRRYGLILSVAVAAAQSSAELSYDISGISEYVDFINLMTYDFHGSWENTAGHNSPLYSAEREKTELELRLNIHASVNYWLSKDAPPRKIILGTAFFGKAYTLTNPIENTPGSPISGAGNAGEYTASKGTMAYYEVCERVANEAWTSVWDYEQLVPYAYLGDQWVSYDNVRSLTVKADYIIEVGLGGAMIWSIDMDDFLGICGESRPLLKTLNVALRGNVGVW